jgi:hypothetical protein
VRYPVHERQIDADGTLKASMDIFEHPGNLGSVRGTILTVHHADWPAYPQGDDFRVPLLHLTAFPPGTKFIVADDIDQSLLLIADVQRSKPDAPYNAKNFHIAVWHEDLRELDKRGFINGIEAVSERQWQEEQWKKLMSSVPEGAHIGYKGHDGEFIPIREPNFDDYEDDVDWSGFVVSRGGAVRITDEGRRFLLAELRAEHLDLADAIGDRVAHLFGIGYYDACIREACVQLEHEIKTCTGSEAWGDQLVEAFVGKMRAERIFLESYVRTFRQELRTVFKFIRNDFMHNLREADEASAHAILFRIARVRSMLSGR